VSLCVVLGGFVRVSLLLMWGGCFTGVGSGCICGVLVDGVLYLTGWVFVFVYIGVSFVVFVLL